MSRRTPTLASTLTAVSLAASLSASLLLPRHVGAQTARPAQTPAHASAFPALRRYAHDLSARARAGRRARFAADTTYSPQLDQLVRLLAREQERNPVLTGETGAGKAALVLALAERIARGDVPAQLRGRDIYSLDLTALVASARDGREVEQRMHTVLDEAADARAILFVDNLPALAGTNAAHGARVNALVADALAAGRLRIVGTTTPGAYQDYIAADAQLAPLCRELRLDETTADAAQEHDDARDAGFVGDKIAPDLRALMQQKSATERVGIILQADDVRSGALAALLRQQGVTVDERMAQLGALRVEAPVGALSALAASGLTDHLSPDRPTATLGHVVNTTGTDQVRNPQLGTLLGTLLGTTTPIDGAGIGIAIIDSGLDVSHKTFAAKADLSGSRIKFKKDFTGEGKQDLDAYGHGTHVASAAAGMSTTAGDAYSGIAPGANIINLRVLNAQGAGTTANLLAALNWILSPVDPSKALSSSNPTNQVKYGIRVVNMSLGAPAIDSYRNDPICQAVRRLVDAGVVVVAAAGNNGKDANGRKIYGQIHSPGIEPAAITVGAANTYGTDARADDGVTTYSSRGPTRGSWLDAQGTRHYDNLFKPDLVAPGNKLIFAESDLGGGTLNMLVTQHPELDSGIISSDNKRLMYLSGTSMATPVVAGAAALMLQVNPQLTPNMIKMILMYTAQPLANFNMLEQGAGEVNVEGAVRLAKLVRTDLTNLTPAGAPLLTSSTPPTPQTAIAGQTFTWAQGIMLKQRYATGTNLITQYQKIYGMGVVLGDGVVLADGIFVSDSIILTDGVVLGDKVLTSDGTMLASGVVLADGVVLGDGIYVSDGIIVTDGVVLADGVVLGDGVVLADGVVLGDSVQAMSTQVNGDDTAAMQP